MKSMAADSLAEDMLTPRPILRISENTFLISIRYVTTKIYHNLNLKGSVEKSSIYLTCG